MVKCPQCGKGAGGSSFQGAAGKVLMIGGAVVAAPCLIASALGFGAAGIVAGSWAAAAQSAMAGGAVAAGGTLPLFKALAPRACWRQGQPQERPLP